MEILNGGNWPRNPVAQSLRSNQLTHLASPPEILNGGWVEWRLEKYVGVTVYNFLSFRVGNLEFIFQLYGNDGFDMIIVSSDSLLQNSLEWKAKEEYFCDLL